MKVLIFISVCISAVLCQDDLYCCPSRSVVKFLNGVFICSNQTQHVKKPSIVCSGSMSLSSLKNRYITDSDGSLTITMKYTNATIPREKYCLARINRKEKIRITPLICNQENLSKINDYCKIVSAVLLLITAILYASVKELRNTHGLSVINLCISLSIGLAILSGMSLVSYSDMTLCAVRGFLAYFFMIASFFWMTALTIQMLLKTRVSSQNEGSFIGYFMFSWGFAGLLTFIMAVINFIPDVDHRFRAGIGLNHCWFFDPTRQWIYMYSVMTSIIAINSCMGIYILIKMCSSEIKGDAPCGSKCTKAVCVFILTGVIWIIEVIPDSYRCTTTEILDLMSTLQGVIIFIVFGLTVLFYQKKYKWNIWKEEYVKSEKCHVPYNNFA